MITSLTGLQLQHILDLAQLDTYVINTDFYPPMGDQPGLAIEVPNYRQAFRISAALRSALGPDDGWDMVRATGVLHGSESVVLYWVGVTVRS